VFTIVFSGRNLEFYSSVKVPCVFTTVNDSERGIKRCVRNRREEWCGSRGFFKALDLTLSCAFKVSCLWSGRGPFRRAGVALCFPRAGLRVCGAGRELAMVKVDCPVSGSSALSSCPDRSNPGVVPTYLAPLAFPWELVSFGSLRFGYGPGHVLPLPSQCCRPPLTAAARTSSTVLIKHRRKL